MTTELNAGTLFNWRFINRQPVSRKLAIMAGALLIPIAWLLYFYVSTLLGTITFTSSEQAGMAYYHPLEEIGGRVADHAAVSATGILRNKAPTDAELAFMKEADEWISHMDELDAKYGVADTSAQWKQIRAEWAALKSTKFPTAEASFAAHRKTVDAINSLREEIANKWNLVLDPEAATYHIIDTAVLKMPDVGSDFGLVRATLAMAEARHSFTDADRVLMVSMIVNARDKIDGINSALALARAAATDRPAVLKLINDVPRSWDTELSKWLADTQAFVLAPGFTPAVAADLLQRSEAAPEQLDAAHDLVMAAGDAALTQRQSADRRTLVVTLLATLAALTFALWVAVAVTRRLSGGISRLQDIAHRIAVGEFDNDVHNDDADEVGELYHSVGEMQARLAADETKRAAAAIVISRLQGALDSTSTNVMVADVDCNIVYMNRAVTTLFREAESDIRRDLPNLNAAKLMGTNIDIFHRTPSHQRNVLANLRGTHTAQMVIGGRTMRIIANPIVTEQGERVGTVVEWSDRTQELAAEKEVASIVDAVIRGDLAQRISLEGKVGFFAALSKGINELVENVSGVVTEVHKLVAAANAGNLEVRMQFEGKAGLNRTLGEGMNDLVAEVSSVVDEVQKLVAAANDGDLTARMPTEGRGGLFQKVGVGINEFTANMSGIVAQVKRAASEVSRGADEISQGNTDLSQRTEEQASSLEETASSMEEMTSTVKQNADNAAQANQLAAAARQQAEKGGAVVSRAVTAMSGIKDGSKRIADIIGVIDEIAFQTNLLALNAAVEAARAGEQGRGFAVVASEVRNLAGRSATAAKEIKALIQDSVHRVDEGSTLVVQSGTTLEEIVAAVKKVADIVGEIAAASHEQSAGIDQVNKAVMQLDELTQQNAALVEEASAASQSMAEQARALNDSMSRYAVDETSAARQRQGRGNDSASRRGAGRPLADSYRRATGTDDQG